jgi:beta-glucosidase
MNKQILILASIFGLAACSQQEQQGHAISTSSTTEKQQTSPRLASVETDIVKLLSQLTLEEKVSLVHANSKFAIASVERLGIHEMWMSDGPHGVRQEVSRDSWASAGWTDDHATYLPPLTAVAASWNTEMATLHGNVLGSEARHRRKDMILGPGVNLARLPLYGRNFEYLGEDPYLAAKLVVPEIKAIQANDVAATLKHYALNTQELNRHGVDAKPDERTLREVYLPAFEAGVKEAGVHAIMGSYNSFRGTNANQSEHLIKTILKGEWDYQGLLVTDWDVSINTYDAAMNGLDIEMGTRVKSYDDYHLAKPFLALLKEGKIPIAVLDDKVRRILRVQLSIGMMDKQRLSGQRNTPEHIASARTIAEQGIVLLKNEGVLPLDKNKLKNVLVLGPNANKKHGTGGGSSQVKSLYEITPLQGLKEKLGEDVNFTVLRAGSEQGVLPIAGDYILTRHAGAGTPAWRFVQYKTKQRKKGIKHSWLPDSAYRSPIGTSHEYVSLKATLQPLKSGIHTLKISAQGELAISVNGKILLEHSSDSLTPMPHPIELDHNQEYTFVLNYEGKDSFTFGWDAPGDLFSTVSEYTAEAKQADAVFYFGGLSHADDRESKDRYDMKLPNQQDEVIKNLLAANPNTVVFINAGSAVEMPWVEQAKAIVWGWYGGMEGGRAYADMLLGDLNPSGKMPITLPKKVEDTAAIALDDYNANDSLYKEGVFIGYRWFEQQQIEPIFPFGHGLSYTQFKYTDIHSSEAQISDDDTITITATITNTGSLNGAEVVQLYLHDKNVSVDRPLKELKGFQRVELAVGESKKVSFILTPRDLSFWDISRNDWLAETGEFDIMLGASLTDIRLKTSFNYYNSNMTNNSYTDNQKGEK